MSCDFWPISKAIFSPPVILDEFGSSERVLIFGCACVSVPAAKNETKFQNVPTDSRIVSTHVTGFRALIRCGGAPNPVWTRLYVHRKAEEWLAGVLESHLGGRNDVELRTGEITPSWFESRTWLLVVCIGMP